MQGQHRFPAGFLDLLFPPVCAGCPALGSALCVDCRDSLGSGGPCIPRPGCPPLWAAGGYGGRLRGLVLAFKTHGCRFLAVPFAEAMAGVVADAHRSRPPELLVPIPPRAGALRRRGYDPAGLLAAELAAALRRRGRPAAAAPVLRIRRRVRDQVGLSLEARRANLHGAFEVHPERARRVEGRAVLLVDDVLTSGATFAEAARALRARGVRAAGAAVVAERG